jgi:hypothetical protein
MTPGLTVCAYLCASQDPDQTLPQEDKKAKFTLYCHPELRACAEREDLGQTKSNPVGGFV